jgi:hypothetical protein
MFKILTALALVTATVLPIDAAKAYGWRSYIIQRACTYLRRGSTAYDAGYNAAKDTINSSYGTTFMSEYQTMSESQMQMILVSGLSSTCPDALL